MRSILFLLICFLCTEVYSQDASQLISEVNKKFAKVHDYQADALIDTKITFLKILPQKAKIYYQKPSKFKVKAQGIAILPKQDFDDLFELLANPSTYTAFQSGTEVKDGKTLALVQIIPQSDTIDLVLAKLWIDHEADLIVKSQLTTRSNGTVLVNYQFGKYADYALPDRMEFTVELRKFKIPKAVSADINSETKDQKNQKESKTGVILISLSNYIVNKGVPSSVFH